jgi:hypothetical protein
MPDNSTPVDPGLSQPVQTEGTSLWNLQTQKPEWVPLGMVRTKLSSGGYRTYAGSDVPVEPGIGGEASLDPTSAATAVSAGATPTHSEPFRDLEARKTDYSRQFDNAGDKALAFTDGILGGLSADLLTTDTLGNKYTKLTAEKNREENSTYEGLGQLAALAAVVLAPESALKYTPLGASNTLFSGTAKATEELLAGKIGSKVLTKGVSEAVGGAVASGALSSAHAVGQAIQGKPVSGYAIVDDIGLGALIGGGLGAVGEKLGQLSKAGSLRKEVEAAARFDESAQQVRGVLTDVSKSWHSAHTVAGARVDTLEDLVKSGLLDTETPGAEWLKARAEARTTADTAKAKLAKVAGTDDPVAIAERLHDLAVSGKAKDAEKLFKAFDEYGTAVSTLDDAMQPTTFDRAHLGDVLSDVDSTMAAGDHPLQRIEQMINNGVPQEEIEAFARKIDENYQRATGHAGPGDATVDLPGGPGSKPEGTPVGERATADVVGERPRVKVEPEIQDPVVKIREEYQAKQEKIRQAKQLTQDEAGFQAKKLLDQARAERETGVMSPARPTQLGQQIQGLLDQLTAATGNRLGTPEARALATKLGMNVSSLYGPVSQKLGDLWTLHKMTTALADSAAARVPASKKGILSKALSWGVVSGSSSVAYEAGGSFAAGATRSLARHALGAALYGAGHVAAAAGRFRQSAVNGLAKALSPVGRRAVGLGAIQRVVSSSYSPNAPATTDFNTKAAQLRQVQANPEPVRSHLREALKGIMAVDPQAYTATVDASVSRMQNLAAALPKSVSLSVFEKSRGPTPAQIQEWHMYEAATADRELVFKYIKSGLMPQPLIEAMNEQHPDFMNEIRDYVLNNPDEVQSASHDTKMALSKLLGVPLVPEANPAFVQRMQEPYIEAKQKAQQNKQQMQGAGAIQAPQPTPAQLLVIQSR